MQERERWHGTAGGYTNHRCRCKDCKDAWRVHMNSYMAADPVRRFKHAARQRRRAAQKKAEAARANTD